jgi:hypothetical protein
VWILTLHFGLNHIVQAGRGVWVFALGYIDAEEHRADRSIVGCTNQHAQMSGRGLLEGHLGRSAVKI